MASLKNLTIFIVFGLLMVVCVSKADDSDAAESKDNLDDDENTIKVYKRLIPADVLRGKPLSHIFVSSSFPVSNFQSLEFVGIFMISRVCLIETFCSTLILNSV